VGSLVRYGTPVVACLAALLALSGPAREDGESGLEAITATGWLAAALAAATLVLAVVNARRGERAGHEQADLQRRTLDHLEEEKRLRVDAEERLEGFRRDAASAAREQLGRIEDVLQLAAFLGEREPTFGVRRAAAPTSADSAGAAPRPPGFPSDELDTQRAVEALQRLELTPGRGVGGPWIGAVPFGRDGRPLVTVISVEIGAALDALEGVRNDYRSALDRDQVDAFNAVLDHPFAAIARDFDQQVRDIARIEDSRSYPVPLVTGVGGVRVGADPDTYLDFVHRLTALYVLLPREQP
jgi:hypothetical protein